MIRDISIKNYKSVVHSELSLGSFNVFIGENGCGKTNTLEAIAMLGAASANKLDAEFFANRGIRVTAPRFMRSAFSEDTLNHDITLSATNSRGETMRYVIAYDSAMKPPMWTDVTPIDLTQYTINVENLGTNIPAERFISELKAKNSNLDEGLMRKAVAAALRYGEAVRCFGDSLQQFVIYSPEESVLRREDVEAPFGVLGRNGEGLLSYLRSLVAKDKGHVILDEIKDNLRLLDWFDEIDLERTGTQPKGPYNVWLHDRYFDDNADKFDQRSANEGFLYLLFFLTLFISDETPRFFAIDNLGAVFNPKLCSKITRALSQLARHHGKQVIITTHNAAVLDGLTLGEDGDRLFVINRNIDGHTRAVPVMIKTPLTVPLSTAWLSGLIGGLPENF